MVHGHKINFGVRIDGDLPKRLDKIIESSKYLNFTGREVVEVVPRAYFRPEENGKFTIVNVGNNPEREYIFR